MSMFRQLLINEKQKVKYDYSKIIVSEAESNKIIVSGAENSEVNGIYTIVDSTKTGKDRIWKKDSWGVTSIYILYKASHLLGVTNYWGFVHYEGRLQYQSITDSDSPVGLRYASSWGYKNTASKD